MRPPKAIKRSDEIPIDGELRVRAAIALPHLSGIPQGLALRIIIANLVKRPGLWVFYPRARDEYAPGTKLGAAGLKRDRITSVVDALAAAGLLEHDRTRPSPNARRRSRFRATPKFGQTIAHLSLADCERVNRELVLRNAHKRDVAFRESGLIRRIRRQVRRINESTAALRLGLNVPSGAPAPSVDFTRAQYTRIFNLNFRCGGRLYGPWWQSLPKEQRQWITINEQPTIEIDVSNCHPRLLRALMGLEPHAADFDMYAIQGVPRKVAKQAFYAIVHTGNRASAIRALADGLRMSAPDVSARHVVDAMLTQRPELRSASGQPGRLQFLDSKFGIKILQTCFDRGIPAVGVHDSFVVPARFADEVRTLVDTQFEALCTRLQKAAVRPRSRVRSSS